MNMTADEPNTITLPLQKVLSLLQNGQLVQAESLCLSLCKERPDYADAMHLLAIIYARSRNYSLSNEYFNRAIHLAPQRGDFLGNYANSLNEQGQFAEAISYSRQAIALGNNRPELQNTLGNALFNTEHIQEAVACYRQAIALQEDYPEAHNNLGFALKKLDQLQDAEHCFRKALAYRPHYDQAAIGLREIDSSWLDPVQGKRVQLRRSCALDAAFLLSCYQNKEFMHFYNQFTPSDFTLDALTERLKEDAQIHPSQKKSISWVIELSKNRKPIGIASLVDMQFHHEKAEFLVGIPASHDRTMGRGIEATLLILDYAFNRVKLNKLYSIVYSDNLVAQRNNLALGFFQESYQRQHIRQLESRHFIDLYGNAMLQDQFRSSAHLAKLAKRLTGRDITA